MKSCVPKNQSTKIMSKDDVKKQHSKVKFKSELLINKIIKKLGLKLSNFFLLETCGGGTHRVHRVQGS